MPCGNEMIRTLEFIESDYAVKLYSKKGLNNLNIAMPKQFPLALIINQNKHSKFNTKFVIHRPVEMT